MASVVWGVRMRVVIASLVVLAGCGGGDPPREGEGAVERRVIGEGGAQVGLAEGVSSDGMQAAGGVRSASKVIDLPGELERLRGLEPGEQVEAIERVVLLLDPESYPLALEVMLSEEVADEARSVLMADLFSHEDAGLRLPALVRVAQSAGDEALRVAALNHLVSDLGEDYGSNWSSWIDAVERQLEGGGERD